MLDENATITIMMLVIILGSISLHEFAHAKSADSAGDPTPRAMGRVTLNPLAHLDPMGTIMIVILVMSHIGIGWGKPVMVNPSRMENPKWDHFLSVLWGPTTNLLLAVGFAGLVRFVVPMVGNDAFWLFCMLGAQINIFLCLFNLLPIGPLDGHWLLGHLLPHPLGARYSHWSRTQGSFVLIGVIILDQLVLRREGHPGILGTILFGPANRILDFLVGA
ncbi:MAG: site-2 protease family protein [Armatimonadetes bacterium]|nr:site-2 protease family protein [Armatimonadota bacterium]